MRITNKFGLPEAIVDAVKNDPYDRGDAEFTITELVDPPRKAALERRYDDELVEDASERLHALFGQCMHVVLERSGRGLKEERFYGYIGRYVVSGKADLLSLDGNTLTDWKLTSVWAARKGEPVKPEWIWQLNGLRALAHQNGYTGVKRLELGALYRDWRIGESFRSGYPRGAETHPVPLWTLEKTEQFFLTRIEAHLSARRRLPECTPEETWNGKRCERYCAAYSKCTQAFHPRKIRAARRTRLLNPKRQLSQTRTLKEKR